VELAKEFGIDPDVMMAKPISKIIWLQNKLYKLAQLKAMHQRDAERRAGMRND
jgi:hypothetical protein